MHKQLSLHVSEKKFVFVKSTTEERLEETKTSPG